MNKILTIIIPTYNMEDYLHKCLDSLHVEDKNLRDALEVLVIIDGSKDRSSEIGHEYEDKYPGVFRVIDKENGNYGSCINRGLKEATGKYVKILDADDEFFTEVLGKLIRVLQENDVDLVLTDVFSHDPDGNITRDTKFNITPNKVVSFKEAYNKSFTYNMCMHAITYNKNIFKDINYHQTEGISYTDNEWACIPMQKVKTIYYLNEYLYSYLRGREGQTMDPAVARKFVSHHITGIRNIAEGISKAQCEKPENEQYLYSKLLERIHLIFGAKLFGKNKNVDKSDIVELDKLIVEKYPVLAKKMEELAYGSSMKGYIKKWRDSNYTTNFTFYKTTIGIYKWFRKLFNRS